MKLQANFIGLLARLHNFFTGFLYLESQTTFGLPGRTKHSEVKMSKTLQWTIGIAVVLIVVSIIFSTVMPFFFPRTGPDSYGMMGQGYAA